MLVDPTSMPSQTGTRAPRRTGSRNTSTSTGCCREKRPPSCTNRRAPSVETPPSAERPIAARRRAAARRTSAGSPARRPAAARCPRAGRAAVAARRGAPRKVERRADRAEHGGERRAPAPGRRRGARGAGARPRWRPRRPRRPRARGAARRRAACRPRCGRGRRTARRRSPRGNSRPAGRARGPCARTRRSASRSRGGSPVFASAAAASSRLEARPRRRACWSRKLPVPAAHEELDFVPTYAPASSKRIREKRSPPIDRIDPTSGNQPTAGDHERHEGVDRPRGGEQARGRAGRGDARHDAGGEFRHGRSERLPDLALVRAVRRGDDVPRLRRGGRTKPRRIRCRFRARGGPAWMRRLPRGGPPHQTGHQVGAGCPPNRPRRCASGKARRPAAGRPCRGTVPPTSSRRGPRRTPGDACRPGTSSAARRPRRCSRS